MITAKEIFKHPITKSFIASSKQMSRYCKVDCPAPKELEEKYNKSLDEYREYLDIVGCKMQDAVHYWDCKDKSTWKYKDVIVDSGTNRKKFRKDVLNPKWPGNKLDCI